MTTRVTIRMYNLLDRGNCFLLRFVYGNAHSFVLVNFGSYSGANDSRELEIAEDIYKTVGDKPLTIILTGEHSGCTSGLISAESVLRKLNVAALWLSSPTNMYFNENKTVEKHLKAIRKNNKLLKDEARARFSESGNIEKMLDAVDLLDQGEKENIAIENLVSWWGLKAKYLSPGQTLKLPEFPEDALNIYTLIEAGSKESSDSGNSANGHPAPLTEKVMSLEASSSLMFDALQVNSAGPNQSDSKDFPFNNKFARPVLPGVDPGVQDKHTKSVIDLYCNTQDWRRIDHVWLNEMGRIALEMNKLRNSNGSLLAFELGKQQRILLFSSGASINKLSSLQDASSETKNKPQLQNGTIPTLPDLLSRVVLYKADHDADGYEEVVPDTGLINEELVIMLPVHEQPGNGTTDKLNSKTMKAYNRITRGRILRSDTIYHTAKNEQLFEYRFASTQYDFPSAVKIGYDRVNESHLYVEYTIH
ncbi:hypothetical protein ACX0G7_17935 [Flavitalea antarctica]